jgi:hypothetical protein
MATQDISPQTQAVIAVGTTLFIGVILLAGSPEYTERVTTVILEQPAKSFAVGLVGNFCLFGLVVILALSRIGIIVLVPLLIGLIPALLVVSVVGQLAVGRLLGRMWTPALVVAVLVSGLIAVVPILGYLGGLVLSSCGLGGVILCEHREDPDSSARRSESNTDVRLSGR